MMKIFVMVTADANDIAWLGVVVCGVMVMQVGGLSAALDLAGQRDAQLATPNGAMDLVMGFADLRMSLAI